MYHAWYYVRPTGSGCRYLDLRPSTTRHVCTCHGRALTPGTSRWAGRYLGRHDKLPIVFSTFTSFVTRRLHVAGPSQVIRVPSLVRGSLRNKQAHTVDNARDLPTRHQSTRTTVIDHQTMGSTAVSEAALRASIIERLNAVHVDITDMSGSSPSNGNAPSVRRPVCPAPNLTLLQAAVARHSRP